MTANNPVPLWILGRSFRIPYYPHNPLSMSENMTKEHKLSGAGKKEARMRELNQETARITWSEMQRFFASGSTIYVDEDLDLIETAAELSLDNKTALEQWINQGKVAPVSDEQAKLWLQQDTLVWAVVMAPWVLVQPIK